jgi:hypothetical protein
MDYVSRLCDLLKKEILMAYISNHQIYLGKITKKGNLIDYISSQKWKYSPEDAKQTPINSEI